MQNKIILVVIPTLGERLEMLEECLDSIFLQNSNVKVVIVFPEKKYMNMKLIQSKFPAVVLEAQDLNFIAAINYAVTKNTDCQYFTLICDDDLLANDCLNRGRLELEMNPDIVGVYGAIDYINLDGQKIGKWNPPMFAQKINSFIPSAIKAEGALFRMDTIRRIGNIPETIGWAVTDIYLIISASNFGKLKKLKGLPVAKFRMHYKSTSNRYPYKVNFQGWKVQLTLGSNLEKVFVLLLGPLLISIKVIVLKLMIFKSKTPSTKVH